MNTRSRQSGFLVTSATLGVIVATSLARPPMELIPVEEGIGDVDSLAADLRVQPRDLRTPLGFERVYRVPGRDDLYMRVSGGLYAVFPRSEYVPGPGGMWPVIPAGTRFYPGGLPPELLGAPAPEARGGTDGPERISLAVQSLAKPLERAGDLEARRDFMLGDKVGVPDASRSIWADEAYRASRVDSIIGAAGSLQQ